jgi:alpha-amylase
MPAVCLILKVHEPPRLRHFSFFDIGESNTYIDEHATAAHLNEIATRCYLPATRILLKQIREFRGDFRLSILLSGVTLTHFARTQPELLAQFGALAESGCVEFICEPFYHSLSFLFSKPEFREQIALQRETLCRLLGGSAATLHDPTGSYTNELAAEAEATGFTVMLSSMATGGAREVRSLNRVYQPAAYPNLKLLFAPRLFADTIARFSAHPRASEKPPTATAFAHLLTQQQGDVLTLSADLQAFADHPPGEAGALEFLHDLPGAVLAYKGLHFQTPAQAAKSTPACGSISIPGYPSWEAAEQACHELIGNEMQKDAIHGLYLLEKEVKAHPDPAILTQWRLLQVSDHFRYMGAKPVNEREVHPLSSPYQSPYDAYINYMNILTDFSERLATPCPIKTFPSSKSLSSSSS